jgi:DNA-binding MarR family transcriptional regulator
VANDLSFDLHALVARLDRSADRILRAELNVSYRRFLALFMIKELEATSQRALAERLDVSEPAVSRMTAVLADAGLLQVEPDPAGGNRRRLRLSTAGDRLVEASRGVLAQRFDTLLEMSGIPAAEYARHTRALLETLAEDGRQPDARDALAAATR